MVSQKYSTSIENPNIFYLIILDPTIKEYHYACPNFNSKPKFYISEIFFIKNGKNIYFP